MRWWTTVPVRFDPPAAIDYFLLERLDVLRSEWPLQLDQLEQGDANGPHIRLLRVRFTLPQLRRHVIRRAGPLTLSLRKLYRRVLITLTVTGYLLVLIDLDCTAQISDFCGVFRR